MRDQNLGFGEMFKFDIKPGEPENNTPIAEKVANGQLDNISKIFIEDNFLVLQERGFSEEVLQKLQETKNDVQKILGSLKNEEVEDSCLFDRIGTFSASLGGFIRRVLQNKNRRKPEEVFDEVNIYYEYFKKCAKNSKYLKTQLTTREG